MNYKYEFTNKIKEKAVLDQIPPTMNTKIDMELPFKFILLRNHFVERLNERLIKNVKDMDEKKWIAQQIIKNREKHYFTFSKKRPNHFMIKTKIGRIPVNVVLILDKLKDVYFAITIYIDLSEKEWQKIVARDKQHKEEQKFVGQLRNKSNAFEKALESLPVVEKQKTHKMKVNNKELVFDEYQTQEWLDSLDSIVVVNDVPKAKKKPSEVKMMKNNEKYVIDSFDATGLLGEAEMFDMAAPTLLNDFEDDFDDNSFLSDDEFDVPLGLDISADDFPWDD